MKRLAALAALCALASMPIGHSRAARRYTVLARITRYVESGYTYSGTYTTLGRTAGCSWDLPLGARLVMPDGQIFVCEDRGVDDGVERVDLYDPYGVVDTYNDWDYVEVLP